MPTPAMPTHPLPDTPQLPGPDPSTTSGSDRITANESDAAARSGPAAPLQPCERQADTVETSTPSTTDRASDDGAQRARMTLWFVAAAGAMALAAQSIQSGDPDVVPAVPTALYILSGLTMAGILGMQHWIGSLQRLVWPGWTWRALGLFVMIVLSYRAAQISFVSGDRLVTERQAVPLWLLAIAGALVCAWPRGERRPGEPDGRRWEVLAVAGIVALAFLLRVPDLGYIPYALNGDETKYALESRAVIEGQLFKPFTTALDGHWVFYLMVNAAFMRVAGQTAEAIRLHSAIIGLLSVVATYALVRQLWGWRAALIAAALLATYHFHIHYSRIGINAIYDSLFIVLTFGWLWQGWLTGRRVPWLMAALVVGVAQYFYVGSRLLLIEIAVLGLFWLIRSPRQVRARALDIGLSIGLFVTIVMPVVYFAQKRPDDYLTRLNQTGLIQSGWLAAEMERRGAGAVEVLWDQSKELLTLYTLGPDGLFYRGQALLTPIMSVLLALSLIYLIGRIREGPVFWLLSSLALILLFGGVLAVNPLSGSQRLLGTPPLLCASIAVFIDQVLTWADQAWRKPRAWNAIGAAAVAGLMLLDAQYYFGSYVGARVLNSADVEWSMQIGNYLHQIEQRPGSAQWQVVCDSAPYLYCEHSNVRFLAPQLSRGAKTLSEPIALVDYAPTSDVGLIVIIAPQLPDEARAVLDRYPSAIRRDHYGAHGDLLFVSVEVPPLASQLRFRSQSKSLVPAGSATWCPGVAEVVDHGPVRTGRSAWASSYRGWGRLHA
jgi:hypothetical protein